MKIAFLVLAHRQIELVYKQIDMLDNEHHHFYIHLDKKFNPGIDARYRNKTNVVFLKDRVNIAWGGFSVVAATLELMKSALRSRDLHDYFVLLSGQCLPIKSNRAIVDFLTEHDGKIFMEAQPLPDNSYESGGLDKVNFPVFFDQLGKLRIEYKKIIFRFTKRFLKTIGYKRKIPFNTIPCFGSQWWALPRNAVEYLVHFAEQHSAITQFFKYTWSPDELFLQTILYESDFRPKITNQSIWFVDWKTDGPPKTLTIDDYENLIKSEKLFARKFDWEVSLPLIEQLERRRSA